MAALPEDTHMRAARPSIVQTPTRGGLHMRLRARERAGVNNFSYKFDFPRPKVVRWRPGRTAKPLWGLASVLVVHNFAGETALEEFVVALLPRLEPAAVAHGTRRAS